MGVVSFLQDHYRTENDDGGPNNPNNSTFIAAEDAITTWHPNINIRLRVKFHASGSVPSGISFRIQYQMDGTGAYADLPTAIPGPPTPWYLVSSSSTKFAVRAATTERLSSSGGGSFVAGSALQSTTITSSPLNMTGARTECEWCMLFNTLAANHYFTFQVHASSVDNWTYTVTPRINVVNFATLRIRGTSVHSPNSLIIQGNRLILKGK